MRQFWLQMIVLGLAAGCASTAPVDSAKRDRDVEAILTQPSQDDAYDKTQRCLTSAQYRDFRVIDDQRIIFSGRGQHWLTTLRTRCPELRHADALRMKSTFSLNRICAMDTFYVDEWFSHPWYRRWPWGSRSGTGRGVGCMLGEFQSITDAQVAQLKSLGRN